MSLIVFAHKRLYSKRDDHHLSKYTPAPSYIDFVSICVAGLWVFTKCEQYSIKYNMQLENSAMGYFSK